MMNILQDCSLKLIPMARLPHIVATNDHAETAEQALSRLHIPFISSRNKNNRTELFKGEPSVKIVSMHSSKGLEFHSVFIPSFHTLGIKEERKDDDIRLFYVAMTRAMDRLVMTYHQESAFIDRIQNAITQVQIELQAS